MIEILYKNLGTFAQDAKLIPSRRKGRKCHVSTLFRWSSAGCRGVVLESIQIGGSRCTSAQALQRFFERLSQRVQSTPSDRIADKLRTEEQRKKAAKKAGDELD